MAWNVGEGHCEIEKGEMNTRFERGSVVCVGRGVGEGFEQGYFGTL